MIFDNVNNATIVRGDMGLYLMGFGGMREE